MVKPVSPIVFHMRELKQSAMWEMLTSAVQTAVSDETKRMLQSNKDAFDYHKGRIEGLQAVIALPDRLIQRYEHDA